MKVLLVNPPSEATSPILPVGLAYIAAVLLENEIAVQVIDAWAENLDFVQLKEKIQSISPDVVGIPVMSPTLINAMLSVDLVKEVCPNAVVVVGGAHASALPEETIEQNKNIDLVVIGEGDFAFLEIVKALRDGMSVDNIHGIAYIRNEKIFVTDPRSHIKDLDSLPMPALHLFPVKKYKTHPPYGRKQPYATMMTSRGCAFSCTYCSNAVFGHRQRMQSPERVLVEIEHLISVYKIKEIHFYDDCFTLDKNRAKIICREIIRRDLKIIWSCTTRLDLVDEELLDLMKQSGCWLIAYGVESGAQPVLDWMNKKMNVAKMKESFLLTKKAGIRTLGYFILGAPGETEKTIQQTVTLCFELDPDFIAWGMLRIFPGSPHFQEMKLDGSTVVNMYNYSSLKHADNKLPFGERGFFVTYEGEFSESYLQAIITGVYRRFYFRPWYILKRLMFIRSFAELIHYMAGGAELIKWLVRASRGKTEEKMIRG